MSQPEQTEEIKTLEKPKTKSKVSIKEPLEEDLMFDLEDVPETPKRGKGRPKKVIEEVDINAPPKQKRVLTEKQKEILEKARKVKHENFQKREAERLLIEEEKEKAREEKQKELERKILKKAISIKKKEIIQQAVLEEDDEDIPTEIVEKIIKKQRAKRVVQPVMKAVPEPVPEPPKYTFVK